MVKDQQPIRWSSALATLLDEAVSAATVSAVSRVLDQTVAAWHRRVLSNTYRYLILDGVSVRIRLVGKVQRRVALCAYGIREDAQRELFDFLLVRSESEAHWRSLLEELWRRGKIYCCVHCANESEPTELRDRV